MKQQIQLDLLSDVDIINMADNNNKQKVPQVEKLLLNLMLLKNEAERQGMSEEEMQEICFQRGRTKSKEKMRRNCCLLPSLLLLGCAVVIGAVFSRGSADELLQRILSSRCLLENNFLVMEMSRPVTDCSICKYVNSVLVLENVTREQFAELAYSSRPMLVKGATRDWTAMKTFSFNFFKELYNKTKGAFESVEEECQFFSFRTNFLSLREVFGMRESRASLMEGEMSWYIGWSNCNPDIAAELRKHYRRPDFLPYDSEASAIDWIFMGGAGPGASLHLDYVQRPSWQAQISGTKTWYLVPPPECENVCTSLNITVEKGDIVMIDTNQWYHNTYVHPGEISITIGSEYD